MHTPPNWSWRADPVNPGPTVVFDMDGVLADAAGRQHLLERPWRNWDAFFEACGDDPLIEDTAHLLHALHPELSVVLLTARPIRVQPQTLGWLARFDLRWEVLIMRDEGDHGSSRRYKQHTIGELRERGFDLRLAFEDDIRNVEMFRAEGVPCVYIHSGYYD